MNGANGFDGDRRLDGWKAIAGYFGRDRTTVARWAKERELPIHHIPGGKQKTVFAYERELAAWAKRNIGEADVPDAASEPGPAAHSQRRVLASLRDHLLGWPIAVAVLILLACYALWVQPSAAVHAYPAQAMPSDPRAASQYVEARNAWGRRTRDDIEKSMRLYYSVIERAPDFAPARVGLAEAWLIYREYGSVNDARAYGAARTAAQKALSLDPGLPSAHRAMGFIQYWWDHDPASAVASFKRAVDLDGQDAQTLFWFANVLADLGEDQIAERYYRRAMLLAPGMRPIEVEHGCAQWQAGRDRVALQLMTELKQRYPGDATISNCLGWVYLSLGDIRAYARELAQEAALRSEPELVELSKALDAALRQDPATAHHVLISNARRQIAIGTRRLREVPAFFASTMGDRAELIALLKEATLLGERWNSPAFTHRIEERWRNDPEISAYLSHLVAPPRHFEGL